MSSLETFSLQILWLGEAAGPKSWAIGNGRMQQPFHSVYFDDSHHQHALCYHLTFFLLLGTTTNMLPACWPNRSRLISNGLHKSSEEYGSTMKWASPSCDRRDNQSLNKDFPHPVRVLLNTPGDYVLGTHFLSSQYLSL